MVSAGMHCVGLAGGALAAGRTGKSMAASQSPEEAPGRDGGRIDERLMAMYYEAESPESERLPYVANVSLPRSGHHLFVRMLRLYFGPRFGYCEVYGPNAKPRCCGQFPCARPGRISTSKNHDFGLKSVLPDDVPVIVQIRQPLQALVSEFELHVANGNPDTAEEFEGFATHRVDRFRKFFAKWVEAPIERRVVIWYEDLCNDAVDTFARAAALFGETSIDRPRAVQAFASLPQVTVADGRVNVVTGTGIREGRDVTAFRFYDRGMFEALAQRAGQPHGEARPFEDGS